MSSYMSCPPYCALGLPEYGEYTPAPQPKSQADCPAGTKFKIREETDGYGNITQIAYCGEPESQADCPDGTTFIQGRSSDGMKKVYTPSQCKKNKSNPKNCEVEWIKELKFRQKVGPSIKLSKPLETKEEFMARCKAENGIVITDPIKPIVDVIKPKTEEEEYRNFIFLTMAAVGVYLILSE